MREFKQWFSPLQLSELRARPTRSERSDAHANDPVIRRFARIRRPTAHLQGSRTRREIRHSARGTLRSERIGNWENIAIWGLGPIGRSWYIERTMWGQLQLKRLGPWLALATAPAILLGCEPPAETDLLVDEEYEAIDQVQPAYDYTNPAHATLEIAYDGSRLTINTVDGDAFRAGPLTPAEVSANIVDASFEDGQQLVLLVDFTNITQDRDYDHIAFSQSDESSSEVSSVVPVLSATTSWDAGETSGSYRFVVDHQGGSFRFFVDITAEEIVGGANDAVHEYSFDDVYGRDDMHEQELRDFFSSFPTPQSTDWMLFEITSPDVHRQGAWCSTRADWYVQNYLEHAHDDDGHLAISGDWAKYFRNYDAAAWEDARWRQLVNLWGRACSRKTPAGAWCAEWLIGNGEYETLTVAPDRDARSELWNWGNLRNGGTLTIRVGPDRTSTCGF